MDKKYIDKYILFLKVMWKLNKKFDWNFSLVLKKPLQNWLKKIDIVIVDAYGTQNTVNFNVKNKY